MTESTVKRFRISDEAAERLAELAAELGTTESDVIRRGLELVDRVHKRQENVERLIELAEGTEPTKVRFTLQP